MDDEKLIELVRKYEFLYNLQHRKYMDTAKKEMAWKQISEELKQSAAACKQRWQGLRDAYRRAINKKKGKSGQAAKKIKKWKYEDEMSFVASFLVAKQTLDSVDLSSDDEESQEEVTEVQNPNSGNEINSTDAVDVAAPHDTEIRSENDSIVHNISSQPQQSEVRKAKAIKKAKVQPKQLESAVLMSRLLDEQMNVSRQCDHEELDRFFLSISATVKKFSPYLQAIAKNKTFSFISEMELQQLAPPRFITNIPQYTDTLSPASSSSSVQTSATPIPPWNTAGNDWNNRSENMFQ
ncbi:transcription factor Adf-1-like [Diorhabda sublineata]|uniref:transcription factor Adf-1-like n=1 Tax=Diorhabda sublineata TaxID=1163346 RepID=UPI0024E0DAB2|nr:transcription factor Adf-1-like [Diorhabda sublineata]